MNQEKRAYFIKQAEQYKPEIYKTTVRPVSGLPSSKLDRGGRALFDFGEHYVGRIRFHCSFTGRHPDAPAFIKVKFCETAREIEADSSSYEGWISKSWIQEEWLHIDLLPSDAVMPRRYAFRFVVIDVIDVSDKFSLVIDSMEAETYTSAEAGAGCQNSAKKDCSTDGEISLEQKLEQVSIRTLRNCMQDVFEDGPKRDRRLWIGDLRLQALANYVSYEKNDLVKRCLYLFAGTVNEEGRVRACLFTEPQIEGDDTYMFDYSLFFIPLLLDYYEATGDLGCVEDLFDTAVRQLEISQGYFDKKHLIRDSDELGWCFLDWNLSLNKQAGAQAVYIYCEKAMIRLIHLLEKEDGTAADRFIAKADMAEALERDVRLKIEAARTHLYDTEKGLFVSGDKGQISYASQVWSVLAGIFDEDTNQRILSRIREKEDAVRMVTPYMYHHYIEALMKCGMKKEAYHVMKEYWGAMIQDGADTFYELFNPGNPEESPYGSSVVNSYCHAWSCTPVYFIRKYDLAEESR